MLDALVIAPKGASTARQELAMRLGDGYTCLGDLDPNEFDDLLQSWLRDLSMDRLRGFSALDQALRPTGDQMRVLIGESTLWECKGFAAPDADGQLERKRQIFSRSSRVAMVRYRYGTKYTWGKTRSNETTEDFKVASAWGPRSWLMHGTHRHLLVARPSAAARADEQIVEVEQQFEARDETEAWDVSRVTARPIAIDSFREHFGDGYPQAGYELIEGIGWILNKTVEGMEFDLKQAREAADRWRLLRSSTTYDRGL